jgi:hypothetical protein
MKNGAMQWRLFFYHHNVATDRADMLRVFTVSWRILQCDGKQAILVPAMIRAYRHTSEEYRCTHFDACVART